MTEETKRLIERLSNLLYDIAEQEEMITDINEKYPFIVGYIIARIEDILRELEAKQSDRNSYKYDTRKSIRHYERNRTDEN
jgi:uncharacterized coiled-coil protein SlyX